MMYYAKSRPIQTIAEHVRDLQVAWENFLSIYPEVFNESEQKLIETAIEYHDLGKLNTLFQQKIINAIKKNNTVCSTEIPHGFLSCAYLDAREIKKSIGVDNMRILLTAIYNHHIREDNYNSTDLKTYIEKYLPKSYIDEITGITYILKDDKARYLKYIFPYLRNQTGISSSGDEKIYLKYIVIKGMLNRIDYAASAGRQTIEIESPAKNFLTNNVNTQINKNKWELRPVQKYMQQHKKENIVVIASTGCGKTEAALLWLDGYKTFYTLPLKVSINAIYERIRHDYGYDESKITLLHSGMLSYYFMQNDNDTAFKIADEPLERQKKARLLSFPLTVCTVDQLFHFVFKAMGTEMIPATLKYSHLVIDEIQMYSPDILAYILYGLNIITKLGGKFAIITATFPPILQELMQENNIEFIPPQEKYYVEKCDSRHKIKCINGEFEYDQIFAKGQKYKVLVLCNTVVKAQKVYRELLKYNNSSGQKVTIKLLHSRFIRKHRALLEDEIKKDAKSNNPIIWIST